MSEIIKDLNWRYAVKSFDNSKKVSQEDMEEIIESFRLTPSSFGLEPWKLIVIENPELKEKLREHSFGQAQITDSSHLLVFARVKTLDDNYVDKFFDYQVKMTGVSRENLSGYENMIKGYLGNLDETAKMIWAKEQVNIALGNVMHTLARKKIDSCAIGGFNPAMYDEILELDKYDLASVVVLSIGYRHENDKYATKPKVRFPQEEVVIKI